MTITLLFDLDDTLVGNPMHTFVPEYSQALAKRLLPEQPDELIRQLFRATRFMAQNFKPDRTLEQAFDEVFFPALNMERAATQPDIDWFYANDFPKLARLTEFKPEAVQAVDAVLERGWQIALATNPLFPKTAILQRLAWSGMPAEKYPWLIVPSYETFHFSKPNPEYFAELLGQIGWPEGPVVMVGNDRAMDILPAQESGLATYWVNPQPSINHPPESSRHGQGELGDLVGWLDRTSCDSLKVLESSSKTLLATLRSSIAALASLVQPLAAEDWCRKPSPEEWCLTEIVCHLRDVEAEVNMPRIVKFIKEENPFITGKDTDIWAKERKYFQQDGSQALDSFIKSRLELVRILEQMDENKWDATARHSIFGPIQLRELIKITNSHDKLHLQTIYQLVKNDHTQE